MIQGQGFRTGLERRKRLSDRGIVERRQPQALHRPAVAFQFQDLARDHLAFAIGVGGDDHLVAPAQQAANDLELGSDLGLWQHLPLLGQDRQVFQGPALEVAAVGFRWRSLQEVPDTPGDGDPFAHQAAFGTPAGLQHAGNVARLGGLFADEQLHGFAPVG